MVLDVRWSMFVVGEGAHQGRIIRMRLWVVPIQLLFAPIDPIAISLDRTSGEIQIFPHPQSNVLIKRERACEFRKGGAASNQDERGMTNDRIGGGQRVNEMFVLVQRWQHAKLCGVQDWGSSVKPGQARSSGAT